MGYLEDMTSKAERERIKAEADARNKQQCELHLNWLTIKGQMIAMLGERILENLETTKIGFVSLRVNGKHTYIKSIEQVYSNSWKCKASAEWTDEEFTVVGNTVQDRCIDFMDKLEKKGCLR